MIDLKDKIPQEGNIYFWKYKTDGWLGSEWHLSTDPTGRIFFVNLLDVFYKSEFPCKYTIQIEPVTQEILSLPGFDSPFENRNQLKLIFNPYQSHYDEWGIGDNEKTVDISFGTTILKAWQAVMMYPGAQKEECSIGLGDEHMITIWR